MTLLKPGERIRLVHCIGTMRMGGAERQLAELIRRLPADRFEQSLVLFKDGGSLLEEVRRIGCPVVFLDYGRKFNPIDPRWYACAGRALGSYIRHLRDRRPHIVHGWLYWANILSVVAGLAARTPVILTARRQLADHKAGRPMLQKIENWANRHTDAVLVNSEAVRRDVLAHEKINPAMLHRIYNGVVLEEFAAADPEPLRREFGLEPDSQVIVYVANLHYYKGHEELVRAVALLKDKYPRLRALCPGRNAGALEFLQGLCAELGVADRIFFPGERKDISAFFALADIAVHPSHQEGFSNSILEAMTAGKPMVVSNVGGCPEAVLEGVNGFVTPPQDAASLAGALDRLLADDALRSRMGQAARERIESEFAIERTVEQYVEFYEKILSKA